MRVPTDEERTIRCLLDDIHGPLNLLFPGIRAKIEGGFDSRRHEIFLRVNYTHPTLGELVFSHVVPKITMRDGSFLEFIMNRVPKEILMGMLERAQAHTAKLWLSRGA